MLNTSLEKIAYHFIRSHPEFLRVTKPRYFENEDIQLLFKLDRSFFERYSKVPNKSQLYQLIEYNKLGERLGENKLDSIFDIRLEDYDPIWLKENVESFIEAKTLYTSVEDLNEYLSTTKLDINNVKDVVNTSKDIILKRNNLSFGLDMGLNFFDPRDHAQPLSDTFSSGYPFIDKCLGGGYSAKTLIAFVGRPKIGKSIWLINLASNIIKSGIDTAYVSFEMRDKKVLKRFGANLLNVSVDDYDDYSQDVSGIKEKLNFVGSDMLCSPGNLYIKEFPASSAGVPDVELYLQKLEELKNIKLKIVYIDYINIMSNWRNPHTENTYMKIKQIAEDIRAMSSRNNWCVVTASQINREGFKSKSLDMSNISESVGLLHTVDGMFAIQQDQTQHLMNEYTLKALAVRDADGMETEKNYSIDYKYMRITEGIDTPRGNDSNNAYDTYSELFLK